MKTCRPLFAVVLALLVGIIGGLVGGSSPAFAVVSIASTGTTRIPYGGVVRGAPEPVLLVGVVQFEMVVVRDPERELGMTRARRNDRRANSIDLLPKSF